MWFSFLGSLVGRLRGPGKKAAVSELRLRYIPAFEEVQPAMRFEVRRARRYERPLVILVLTADGPLGVQTDADPASGNGSRPGSGRGRAGEFVGHVSSMLLGEILHVAIREVDIVGYDPKSDRYVICLPESDAGAANHAMDRIEKLSKERAVENVRVGSAVFPRDALTLEDLMAHADKGFRRAHLSVYREEASA